MNQFDEFKHLVEKRFEKVVDPGKNDYVIAIREELVDAQTGRINFSVALGKVMRFPNRVSINGKLYRSGDLGNVQDSSLVIPVQEITKPTERVVLAFYRTPETFPGAVDKASWENKLETLEDLISLVENFDPDAPAFSFF